MLIECQGCKSKISSRAQNCTQCGAPIEQAVDLVECQDCKTAIPTTAKTCPKCGAPLEHSHNSTDSDKDDPPEWMKFSIRVGAAVAGVFVIRTFFFEPFTNIFYRILTAFAGESGFMTDLTLFFADYTAAKEDFWMGYAVPFGITYFIASLIFRD